MSNIVPDILISITHNSLQLAYAEFKKKHPSEEPHIRVTCTRRFNAIFQDPKFDFSWRKTLVDEKQSITEEDERLKKVVMTKQVIEVDPNLVEKQVKGTKKQKLKIRAENEKTRQHKEKVITEKLVSVETTPNYPCDYVVNSLEFKHSNRVIARCGKALLDAQVESVDEIPNGMFVFSNPDVDLDYTTLMNKINEMRMIEEESKKHHHYLTDKINKLLNEVKQLNKFNQYFCDSSTSTSDLVATNDKGIQNDIPRSGKKLWEILRFKMRNMVKRVFNVKEAIRSNKSIIQHYENLHKSHFEENKKLEEKIIKLNETLNQNKELESKVKKAIMGNKSVNEICESYILLQKKLNDLKSNIVPVIIKHTRVPWESWVKEFGFIKSLELLIKHYDSEYDSPDEDYDAYDHD